MESQEQMHYCCSSLLSHSHWIFLPEAEEGNLRAIKDGDKISWLGGLPSQLGTSWPFRRAERMLPRGNHGIGSQSPMDPVGKQAWRCFGKCKAVSKRKAVVWTLRTSPLSGSRFTAINKDVQSSVLRDALRRFTWVILSMESTHGERLPCVSYILFPSLHDSDANLVRGWIAKYTSLGKPVLKSHLEARFCV